MLRKIVSGGQTGADRAALDWAIGHGVPHGGWCPRGRRAEDGTIAERYQLVETPSRKYRQRTLWNVRDSEATVLIGLSEDWTGGSKKTIEFAEELHRPHLAIVRNTFSAETLRRFVLDHGVGVLNIAGPRESKQPGIGAYVHIVLESSFDDRVGGRAGGPATR